MIVRLVPSLLGLFKTSLPRVQFLRPVNTSSWTVWQILPILRFWLKCVGCTAPRRVFWFALLGLCSF